MGNKKILLRKIILRLIIVMFIIIAFIVIVIAVINIYMKSVTSSKILSVDECKDMDADCILVLGAGVAPSGKPTWMLEDRILTSEELYNVNASPKIIMSGDHGRVSYDEVNTMKDYAINDGIPSDDIFMDHAGFSTNDSNCSIASSNLFEQIRLAVCIINLTPYSYSSSGLLNSAASTRLIIVSNAVFLIVAAS